jgi:hypothetical protein
MGKLHRRSTFWAWQNVGNKIDCIADPSRPRFGNVYPMAPVVLHARANIPPHGEVIRFVMGYDLCAWWSKWGGMTIKLASKVTLWCVIGGGDSM